MEVGCVRIRKIGGEIVERRLVRHFFNDGGSGEGDDAKKVFVAKDVDAGFGTGSRLLDVWTRHGTGDVDVKDDGFLA